jgi:hypothetical protein
MIPFDQSVKENGKNEQGDDPFINYYLIISTYADRNLLINSSFNEATINVEGV